MRGRQFINGGFGVGGPAVIAGGVGVSVYPSAEKYHDLAGWGVAAGGAIGLGIGVSAEYNASLDLETAGAEHGFTYSGYPLPGGVLGFGGFVEANYTEFVGPELNLQEAAAHVDNELGLLVGNASRLLSGITSDYRATGNGLSNYLEATALRPQSEPLGNPSLG